MEGKARKGKKEKKIRLEQSCLKVEVSEYAARSDGKKK
jgi:hypothetical protein